MSAFVVTGDGLDVYLVQVLSISRNKLHKLPAYFHKFRHLTVLKVDRNPIEWPPPSVMETTDDLEEADAMHGWVDNLKTWLQENSSPDSTSAQSGEEKTQTYIETPQNTPLPR